MKRGVGYLWASPVTFVGLTFVLVAVLSGGKVRLKEGVIECHGGWVARLLRGGRVFGGGAAMTLGHVVLARDEQCLETSRPHERVHVRQFERWGPFLLPAYFLVGCWLSWRGFDPHLDNPFEREAYERSHHS